MTQEEFNSNLIDLLDYFYCIVEHQQLLEAAIESNQSFSEKNFDRLLFLTELYHQRIHDFIHDASFLADKLYDELSTTRHFS